MRRDAVAHRKEARDAVRRAWERAHGVACRILWVRSAALDDVPHRRRAASCPENATNDHTYYLFTLVGTSITRVAVAHLDDGAVWP